MIKQRIFVFVIVGVLTGSISISNANLLDEMGVENFVTGLDNPFGIALYVDGDKMYWAGIGTNKIQHANLNVSNIEDFVAGLICPDGIALDISSGEMYRADYGSGEIQWANLDGSNVEGLVTVLSKP